jgi:F-type H+-transporting ATPase subunit a
MKTAETPLIISAHFLGFRNWINPLIMAGVIFIVFLVLLWMAKRRLQLIPSGIQNFVEMCIEFIENLSNPLVGREAEFFFPLFVTLFFFVFFSNLIGLVPGLVSPTSRVDINLSMALIVFLSSHYFGIKKRGLIHYFKHFLPPKLSAPTSSFFLKILMASIYGILCFLMPLIHLMGEITKPISLTLRLFGNIMGKEKVLAVLLLLIIVFFQANSMMKMVAILPFALRIFMILLGIFICFVQAFIFMLLAMVYIGTAIKSEPEELEI